VKETSQHNARQVAYFSSRALPRMDPATRSTTPYTLRQLRAVVDAVGAGPGDRVLDVGCGPGKYTVGLAALGLDVTGLDLTPALVDALHEAAPDVPAQVGDLLDPPAELHGRFDVVTGFFVLHHLTDLERAFAGVRALLRPGGRAAFCEPNPLFPGYYAQVTLTPGMSWRGEAGIVRMRERPLAQAAASAGLAQFRTDRFGAFPPALANRPRGRQVERWLEAVPGWRRARAFQLFSMRR
jgi:2-polyprenyl-3-methyl-5-hydroxy-6-metoxy-1,4-benzoquinol methylase